MKANSGGSVGPKATAAKDLLSPGEVVLVRRLLKEDRSLIAGRFAKPLTCRAHSWRWMLTAVAFWLREGFPTVPLCLTGQLRRIAAGLFV